MMRLFNQGTLRNYLAARIAYLRDEVQAEDRDKLLNMNETQYIDYLVERYKMDPLILDYDHLSVSDRQEMFPAESFPRGGYDVRRGQLYRKQVVTYHIPYSGNADLLKYAPTMRHAFWALDVERNRDSICFDIVAWRDDPKEVSREADQKISSIRMHAQNIAQEVAEFNQNLEKTAREIVRVRKAQHLKQANLLGQLHVPVQKARRVPATFTVPSVRKKVIVKPAAPNTRFEPDPTLDEAVYQAILKICHELGVEMERHPLTYDNKDEESLRDNFILLLTPQFESVTGEPFNKAGKTDILIRHEKSNVFVAECKFWRGIKAFYDAIDQILRYLTWRDSKAALICFIQARELAPVLSQIESETAQHPQLVKYHGHPRNGQFDFEFHLPGDPSRSVRLAVLCFHFPPVSKKQ